MANSPSALNGAKKQRPDGPMSATVPPLALVTRPRALPPPVRMRHPVSDLTGIEGRYDFPYDYSLEETGRDSAPSIFTVVADLGLKLESRKASFDVVVIDGGNKIPAEN